MLLPKSIRKFIAVFRGEVSPILILLSAALGFWFGLTPGWYGIHMALLVLVLVLNVHIGIFLMSAAFGKALCFAAAPVLFYVGRWAQGSFTPVLEFLAALPVIGITDFARYSVAGSVVLGPVLGLVCGVLLARSVTVFRRTWLSFEENSEAFRKWHSNRWVRLLDRLLIGKRAKDVRSVLKRRPKVIRLAGVVVAVVLVAASAIGLRLVGGDRLADLAAESLTKANGAEVNLAQLDLTVFAGRVSAKGLQVTDPENPANNRLAIDELTADASLWELARGRVVMDNVVLAGVVLDRPRASAGRVTRPVPKTEPPKFVPARFNLPGTDVDKLEAYFGHTEKMREWFRELAKWLPEPKAEAPPPPPPVPQKYLEYLTARAPVPPTPRIVVKRAALDGVDVPMKQVGRSTITCTNLSNAPAAAGLPVTIALQSRERPISLSIVCHYDRPEGGVEITGSIGDVDLRELQAELNPNNPVTFEGGTATATVSGGATRETVDVAIQFQTKGMRARSAGGGLFGLDPQVTAEATRLLENIQTTLRLVGPTTEPRLVFDGSALTKEFKDALVRAGKDELARRVDELLAGRLPVDIPKPAELLKDPLGAASDALTGLVPGEKKDEQQDREGKADKQAEKKEQDKGKDDPLSRLKRKVKKTKP